jgi:Zn-dependent protease
VNLSMGGRWEPTDRRGPRLDDPMSWSIPLGRLAGIDVRMHLLLPLFAAVELGRSALGHSALGTGPTAVLLAWLLFSVLLHELGHCFACRRFGGEADEVVLWPLGGLAACRPREGWAGELATAVGGPIVNLALAAVACATLTAMGAPIMGVAIPNPLDPVAGLVMVGGGTAQGAIFLLAWINVVLLMLNLVPMPPLDGGAIVQALQRRKRGESEATRGAVRIGYIAAVALAIVGMLTNQLLLVGLAVVGGVWCHRTSRRLAAERDEGSEANAFETDAEAWRDPGPDRISRSEIRAEREAAREEAAREREQAELDRILEKIQRGGMDGLSPFERRFLKKVTRRRRET